MQGFIYLYTPGDFILKNWTKISNNLIFQPHKSNSHCGIVERDEPGHTTLPHVAEHGRALVLSVSNGF